MIARLAIALVLLLVGAPAVANNAAGLTKTQPSTVFPQPLAENARVFTPAQQPDPAAEAAAARQQQLDQMYAFLSVALPIVALIALPILALWRGKRWSLNRVWALRLVIGSAGLLICLLTFRDALADALSSPLSYAILYDGWGIAFLAVAALTGIYRLMIDRIA